MAPTGGVVYVWLSRELICNPVDKPCSDVDVAEGPASLDGVSRKHGLITVHVLLLVPGTTLLLFAIVMPCTYRKNYYPSQQIATIKRIAQEIGKVYPQKCSIACRQSSYRKLMAM